MEEILLEENEVINIITPTRSLESLHQTPSSGVRAGKVRIKRKLGGKMFTFKLNKDAYTSCQRSSERF